MNEGSEPSLLAKYREFSTNHPNDSVETDILAPGDTPDIQSLVEFTKTPDGKVSVMLRHVVDCVDSRTEDVTNLFKTAKSASHLWGDLMGRHRNWTSGREASRGGSMEMA